MFYSIGPFGSTGIAKVVFALLQAVNGFQLIAFFIPNGWAAAASNRSQALSGTGTFRLRWQEVKHHKLSSTYPISPHLFESIGKLIKKACRRGIDDFVILRFCDFKGKRRTQIY
jgi:hypothetical protein